MGLPLDSRASYGTAISSQGEFEITAKAIQLDAFFTFLLASVDRSQELSEFCQLVFDTVAGPDAYRVREHLLEYSKIRQNEEPSEAVSAILFAASTGLQPALTSDRTDLFRFAKYVLTVVELMHQGLRAVESCAVLIPPKTNWHQSCDDIAEFLEQGRKGADARS